MVKMLSFKMWLEFAGMILNSLYPAEIVLVLFSTRGFSKLKTSPVFRWLAIFLVCDLGIKMFVFFVGIPFSSRYLLPFSLVLTLFCAAGIIPLAGLLQGVCSKAGIRLSQRVVISLILLIVGLSYAGKGLNPRSDKIWLSAVADAVSAACASGDVPILISTSDDERVGYYAGTEEIYILQPGNNWCLLERREHGQATKWMPCSIGPGGLKDYVLSLGPRRVFFVLNSKDTDIVRDSAFLVDAFPGTIRLETLDFGRRGIFEILLLDTRGHPE